MGWFSSKKADDGLVDAEAILRKENAIVRCRETGERVADGNVTVAPLGDNINWQIDRGPHKQPARGRTRR